MARALNIVGKGARFLRGRRVRIVEFERLIPKRKVKGLSLIRSWGVHLGKLKLLHFQNLYYGL